MFLATASHVHSLCQILGLSTFLPAPLLLFSGRLYAHLHSRTVEGMSLFEALQPELPEYEMALLRSTSHRCSAQPAPPTVALPFVLGHKPSILAGVHMCLPNQGIL
jgi:hypothetical protein